MQKTRHLAGHTEARIFWATGIAGALFLLALIFAGSEFWLVQKNLDAAVRYSAMFNAERSRLLNFVNEETGVRAFVATGDDRFLDIYYNSHAQLPELNATLSSSTANAVIGGDLATASAAQDRIEAYFQDEMSLVRNDHVAAARSKLAQEKVLFDRLRDADGVLADQLRERARAKRANIGQYAAAGLAGTVAAFLLLSVWWIAFALAIRQARAYRRSALRDALTGALNRRGALAAIESHIGSGPQPFGVVFIDLDGFKKVNDSYGHAAGDMILRAVATRLRSELRSNDDVCRLGGDEFVCVLSQPAALDQVRAIASRLRKSIARPYSFEGEDYIIGCSVGVCVYPDHGASADVLLSVADRAMYGAKASGGGVREAVTA